MKVFCNSTPPTMALAKATQTIPLVFANTSAVTVAPLVQTFARPGGNITGFLNASDNDVYGKNIELLKELAPTANRFAVIYGPGSVVGGEAAFLSGYAANADRLGLNAVPFPVRSADEITEALGKISADSIALIVNGDSFMTVNRAPIIIGVARYRLTAVWSAQPAFFSDGGMIGYAPDVDRMCRGAQ